MQGRHDQRVPTVDHRLPGGHGDLSIGIGERISLPLWLMWANGPPWWPRVNRHEGGPLTPLSEAARWTELAQPLAFAMTRRASDRSP